MNFIYSIAQVSSFFLLGVNSSVDLLLNCTYFLPTAVLGSLTHSLTHRPTHSPTHPPTHWITHSLTQINVSSYQISHVLRRLVSLGAARRS